MNIKLENKNRQVSGVAQYWLVWFAFIFALIYYCKSQKPLWLIVPAVVCVPVGNPIKTLTKIILEVRKCSK